MGTVNWQIKLAKVAVSLMMVLLVVLSFGGNADKISQEYTETGFKRALVTFASARAINGLISVAQGTEVAVQPAGIGAVFTPGEILDPINDLVEQFSQVMLFSAAVLGTQKLLIEMSGWVWFSALLASAVLFWQATFWMPQLFTPRTQRVALALSGLLLLFRFLVPLAAIANEAIFEIFLAPGYEEAIQELEVSSKELGSEEKSIEPSEEQTESNKSSLDTLREYYERIKEKSDISPKIEELKTAANKTITDIINLIIIFMVQTLLLPLLFAWLGFSAAKGLVRYALSKSE
ncbi:MAG: hypothetical protein WBO57_11395 [Gammaproteobacteria bacterium]